LLLCLVILGPLLLVIGVWQFLEAPNDHERDDNISKMNTVIDEWNMQYLPIFQNQSFSVQNTAGKNWINMLADRSGGISANDLHSYVALKYNIKGQIIPSQVWNSGQQIQIYFKDRSNSSWSVSTALFVKQTTNDLQTTCYSKGGQPTNSNCYYYYYLSDFCVKVTNRSGYWAPDNSYGGFGCLYGDNNPSDSGNWNPGYYQQALYNNGSIFHTQFDFSSVTTTIRHLNDPYVYAQYLTQGSMDFGLTRAQKALVGLVLIVIGSIFSLPCCVCLVLMTVCFSKRRHHHHHHHTYSPIH